MTPTRLKQVLLADGSRSVAALLLIKSEEKKLLRVMKFISHQRREEIRRGDFNMSPSNERTHTHTLITEGRVRLEAQNDKMKT